MPETIKITMKADSWFIAVRIRPERAFSDCQLASNYSNCMKKLHTLGRKPIEQHENFGLGLSLERASLLGLPT